MKKIFQIIGIIILIPLLIGQAFGAECTLNTVPSPAVDSYKKNVETILEAMKKLSDGTVCTKPDGGSSYLDVAIPAQSVQALLGNMRSAGYNISNLLSDIRYYFDSSDVMLLPNVSQHQTSILEIQQKTIEAGIYIGSKCAQGVVTFKEDVKLEGSNYSTKDKTLQVILNDISGQTTHVLKFYRNLVTNVADREYLDETHFPVAPKGFAQNMRDFYSSANIQQCHEEEPKNQKIKEVLKQAFTTGWKYPQAIQIWKDAFALLLYRGGQITGGGEQDAAKEAKIDSLVQAQKGGVGNSRFLLNGQLFKEFGKRGNNQTVFETVKEAAKRVAYQTFGSLYLRKTVPDLTQANGNSGVTSIQSFPQSDTDARKLETIDKTLYTDYSERKVLVGQSKEQDPKTVVGLIQALEQLELARPTVEEIAQKICDIYAKQATNVPRPTCQELFNV